MGLSLFSVYFNEDKAENNTWMDENNHSILYIADKTEYICIEKESVGLVFCN